MEKGECSGHQASIGVLMKRESSGGDMSYVTVGLYCVKLE